MIALLAVVVAAAAPALPVEQLRYERALRPRAPVRSSSSPTEACTPTRARTSPTFVSPMRAAGRVPWRPAPQAPPAASRSLRVLNSGRRGAAAVALVDRGPAAGVIDRVTLDVSDSRFVGSVAAFGSDDRSSWTLLSTAEIYSVGGATPARSTTALLPPTDFALPRAPRDERGAHRRSHRRGGSTLHPRLVLLLTAHVGAVLSSSSSTSAVACRSTSCGSPPATPAA